MMTGTMAKQKAEEIIAMGEYDLEDDYLKLFQGVAGQDSRKQFWLFSHIPNILYTVYHRTDV